MIDPAIYLFLSIVTTKFNSTPSQTISNRMDQQDLSLISRVYAIRTTGGNLNYQSYNAMKNAACEY